MIEDKNLSFTPLSNFNEFELIHEWTKNFKIYHSNLLKGIGDDCAVQDLGNGKVLLTSTDFLVEGVHFDLSYYPPVHLGYKAAMVNFSDIIAMNALPNSITVSIACSNCHSFELIQQIYSGIQIACDELQVDLIGGDTSSTRKELIISITVNSIFDKNKIVFRDGAKHADIICVTGDLGAAYAGLQILEREKQVYLQNKEIQPDLSEYSYVIERQLRPRARYDIVHFLAQNNILPTSMIDISDGLANEINHLCKNSKLGAVIYQDKLYSDYETQKVAELLNIPLTSFILYGGEDYELLFTAHPSKYIDIQKNKDIKIIGYMTEQFSEPMLLQFDESFVPIKPYGYHHFNKS
jgi:thiamine-monophosphate kinase